MGVIDALAVHKDAQGDQAEWDVIGEIPNDSAAALILLEHHRAVPLRDAIARAGGYRVADGMISAYLLAIGLASAAEAKELQAHERPFANPPS